MDDAQQLSKALAGRYDVEREIGRGGMATVYLARDGRHGRPVAIKLLDPELGAVLGVAENVRTAPTFSVSSRNVLFRDRFVRGPYHANYDVMPDGAHLLLLEAAEPPRLMITHNWADEVRRRMRGGASGNR